MTIRVVAAGGSAGSAGPARLAGPDGLPARAALDLVRFGIFRPDAIMPPDEPGATFVLDADSESALLKRHVQLHGGISALLAPNRAAAAEIKTGRGPLKATRLPGADAATGITGVPSIPLDGLLNRDGFTIVAAVSPQAADLTAAGRYFPVYAKAASDSAAQVAYIDINGTTVTGAVQVDESAQTGGSNVSLTATFTLAVGDVASGEWGVFWLTYNADADGKVRVGLHQYVDGGAGDLKKEGVSAGTNATLLKRPFSGNPRIQNAALFIGADRNAGATTRDIHAGEVATYPIGRTWATQKMVAAEGVTVDAATTVEAWNDKLTAMVGHYSHWARNEAAEASFAAIRDAQIALVDELGMTTVRLAESHERSTVVLDTAAPPGTVTSVNTADLVTHWRRFLDRGITKVLWHVGYTPTAFGGGASGNVPPNIAGFTETQAFDLYARYFSALITDFKTRLTSAGYTLSTILQGLSFWNEPDATGFWNGTTTQHVDLWQKVATQLATDHPDLPALGTGDMSGYSTTAGNKVTDMPRGVMDRAQANGLQVGSANWHNYKAEAYRVLEQAKAARRDLDARGFTTKPVRLNEFGLIIGAGPASLVSSQRIDPPVYRGLTQGAYCHKVIAHLAEDNENTLVDVATFFRIGQQGTYSTTAASEEEMGALSASASPRLNPTGAVYALLWKHAGNRVTATSNRDRLQPICTKTAGGVITLTVSSYKLYDYDRPNPFQIEWAGLPATFTWKQWRVDFRDGATRGDGRPVLFAQGDQANLPNAADVTNVGVVCIQVTP